VAVQESRFVLTHSDTDGRIASAIYQNPYLAVANRGVSSGLPPVRDEKAEKFFGWCK
jgi:hypothetical protein